MAATMGSAAGPWVGVIAGLVAAGAYIAASFLKDDQLEMFLKRCEWGEAPYSSFEDRPKWTPVDPDAWRKDYSLQQRLLLRLLGRVTVSWTAYPQAVLGVRVRLEMAAPDTKVRVEFRGVLANGEVLTDAFAFAPRELPRLPGELIVQPSRTYNDWTHPASLTAVVFFQLTPDSPADEVRFSLIRDGADQKDDEASNV